MKSAIVATVREIGRRAVAPDERIWQVLARTAALGLDGVELTMGDPAELPVDVTMRQAASLGLTVCALGTGRAYTREGMSLVSRDPGVRRAAVERLRACVELAARFGALVVVSRIRGSSAEAGCGAGSHVLRERLCDSLGSCAEFAMGLGVPIGLEPLNRYETDLVNTVEEGLAVINDLGMPNVGLVLDTFHMNVEEPRLKDSVRKAAGRIFHVHVADSNGWAPGYGHIDFEEFVGALVEIRYDGFLSAQILPKPDQDTATRVAASFLKAAVRQARERMGGGMPADSGGGGA